MNFMTKEAKQIANNYLHGSTTDPTQDLIKVAKENNLSAKQIERIANKANRKISAGMTKKAAKGEVDPHFVFPSIKTANVIMALKGTQKAKPGPPVKKVQVSRVFDFDEDKVPRSTVHDDPNDLVDDPEMEIPSRAIALSALKILKHKTRLAKSKLQQKEIAIDRCIKKFEKCASHEFLSGTPMEAFRKLPKTVENSIQKVASNVKDMGHDIEHIEEEIELNQEHPLVKIAQEIAFLEDEKSQAASKYTEQLEKLNTLKERL